MAVVMEFKQGVQCVYVCVYLSLPLHGVECCKLYMCVCVGLHARICACSVNVLVPQRLCVFKMYLLCFSLNLTFKLNDAEIQI